MLYGFDRMIHWREWDEWGQGRGRFLSMKWGRDGEFI